MAGLMDSTCWVAAIYRTEQRVCGPATTGYPPLYHESITEIRAAYVLITGIAREKAWQAQGLGRSRG